MPLNSSIILVSPRNSLNIGVSARAMANFALGDLRLVNPYGPSWQEAHSAIKAEHIMENAQVFTSLEDAVKDRSLVFALTSLDRRTDIKKDIVSLPRLGEYLNGFKDFPNIKTAFVFGQEKRGLTNDEISLCHAIINIPTCEKQPSMNLAQAVTVCCYEISKLNSIVTEKHAFLTPATADEIDKLATEVNQIFKTVKFESNVSDEQRLLKIKDRFNSQKLTAQSADYIRKIIMRFKKYL